MTTTETLTTAQINALRTARRYVIHSRIPGKTPWGDEGSGESYASREAAEEAMATLEPTNEDGEALEYQVVEV